MRTYAFSLYLFCSLLLSSLGGLHFSEKEMEGMFIWERSERQPEAKIERKLCLGYIS